LFKLGVRRESAVLERGPGTRNAVSFGKIPGVAGNKRPAKKLAESPVGFQRNPGKVPEKAPGGGRADGLFGPGARCGRAPNLEAAAVQEACENPRSRALHCGETTHRQWPAALAALQFSEIGFPRLQPYFKRHRLFGFFITSLTKSGRQWGRRSGNAGWRLFPERQRHL